MKRFLFAIALASVCSVMSTAAASPSAGSSLAPSDSDCSKAREAGRTCKLSFDGDVIGGDRPAGEGEQVTARRNLEFSSLITVRSSFRDLIIKTADRL